MKLKLKPIREQVIVITGADSGIGLATARLAAERGAQVVLCSRNAEALERICDGIHASGGQAEWYAGDVADELAMRELAELAVRAFGRIDTWVNNAGVSVYGRTVDIPTSDARRLFETNYWGMVNGSLAAVPHLRGTGGALVNVGSVVSDRSIPLQGHYSASKHAVKAFTDALRMELEHDGVPVSVTLVKPAGINTPYTQHAVNRLHEDEGEPYLPPPVYAPRVVAEAILHAASHPQRSITVGGGGRVMGLMGRMAPGLAERQLEATLFKQQVRKRRKRRQDPALFGPPDSAGREEGDYDGHVMRSSAYTAAAERPGSVATAVALGAVAAGVVLAARNGWFGGVLDDLRPWVGGGSPERELNVQVETDLAGHTLTLEAAPRREHEVPLM